MTIARNWSYPTAIKFGAGRIKRTRRPLQGARHEEAAAGHRPWSCAHADHPELRSTLEAGRAPRAIFADVDPNPNDKNLEAGVKAFKDGGHDGVVAFGGGSASISGKCVAFMAGQTRPVWDFEDVGDWWTRADPEGIAPIVAVPTTAGTGSEVGRASSSPIPRRTPRR
jgi:alcohol dehydrogenase class IV